MIIKPQYK